ncbi:MAG: NAD(P)H-binding protein [Chloroflexi bacterium]|nr:NAD(P)H-binding protein [Chloroflexota bacterium]
MSDATTIPWMLYGAYGYTGELIAEEALRRGHRPLLAGRNSDKLIPLAERLGLDYRVVVLDDPDGLHEALNEVDLVLHAAGPFLFTAEPMLNACLDTATHYLDITGEISVFDLVFAQDDAAREQGIVLIPGVGFDVVPSDCLAKYVADQLPDATQLELAVKALESISRGTTLTALESMGPVGFVTRRDDAYQPIRMGTGSRVVAFPEIGECHVMPIPLGDLSSAARTTGIENINTSLAMARWQITATRLFGPVLIRLVGTKPAQRVLAGVIDRVVKGPSETARETGRSHFWAKATAPDGRSVEAWLVTAEVYKLTALVSVRAVERVLNNSDLVGALTPAGAFGADFILETPDSQRYDQLP